MHPSSKQDIQTDGTIGGMHVALRGAYHCVVRDSYCHHSADYGYAKDCYGISIGCASADNLIENNIVRYMNKPLQFSNSGGGNVFGYNYADNAWSSDDGSFQEVPIDAHCAFPHMELVEGNWAPHMALPDTHGASGYITFFRNYSSSQFAYPPVYGKTSQQTGDVQALSMCTNCIYVNAVGNVFDPEAGSDSKSSVAITQYIASNSDNGILCFGNSKSTPAFNTALIHGNYDTYNKKIMWDATNSNHTIPNSLYLKSKPAFFGSNTWPWVTPDATKPIPGILPAKERSDSLQTVTYVENSVLPSSSVAQSFKNFPNPFHEMTEISYEVKIPGLTNITIYDFLGKEVITLVNQNQAQGLYSVKWNGKDAQGNTVSKGIYLYRIKNSDELITTKKMILE